MNVRRIVYSRHSSVKYATIDGKKKKTKEFLCVYSFLLIVPFKYLGVVIILTSFISFKIF